MKHRIFPILLVMTAIASATGCSRPPEPSPSPRSSAAATPTLAPSPTHTLAPPSAEPTVTPVEELPETPEPVTLKTPLPLTVYPDERSTKKEGHLAEGEAASYLVQAPEGELMEIAAEASEPIILTFQDEEGNLLLHSRGWRTSWEGERPDAGTGLIEIYSGHATHYTLTVAVLPVSAEPSLELLVPNGGEEWLEGSTETVVWRSSGLGRVDIEVASGGKPLGHIALGVDAASGEVTWDIPVGLVSNFGVTESDGMRVRISDSDDPAVSDENDEPFTVRCPRIAFEPGARSATITGTLPAGRDTYRYALSASAGQTLEIVAQPRELKVDVSGVSEASAWQKPAGDRTLVIPALPATQDYFVTLATTPLHEDETVEYTLEIFID
ncbi:MAG: hypothetical protein ACOC8C_02465 [Chloroflexota bacterium]